MKFTQDNAKLYSARGNIAKWKMGIVRKHPPLTAEEKLQRYVNERVKRVRKQLEKLETWMIEEVDAQKLDRVASAYARLSEVERQLSGRPMPGSLKPSSATRKRSEPAGDPTPAE